MHGGGAAAAAAVVQAIKASGVLLRVQPEDFRRIVGRNPDPLVVCARGGFFNRAHCYLTSYKGLAFYTKAEAPIEFPGSVEKIVAKRIWVPG